jgi:hypothetical protein
MFSSAFYPSLEIGNNHGVANAGQNRAESGEQLADLHVGKFLSGGIPDGK